MLKTVNSKLLMDKLPEGTYLFVETFFNENPVELKVTSPRVTKQGDFRSPFNGKPAKITINNNLNAFAFFITLIHEMAHYVTWRSHGKNVQPHGPEWKSAFKSLMSPFIQNHTFPNSVNVQLTRYMENPAAATCSDQGLYLALRNYDEDHLPLLKDLDEGTAFSLPSGRTFIKGKKRRTRFICTDVRTKKQYVINQLAYVTIQ